MKTKILITESQYEILLENINEQNKSMTIGGGKVHLGKKGTDVNKFNKSGGNYTVTIPENEWDRYIAKNERKLINVWGNKSIGTSPKNWAEIKINDKRFAVGILETFIEGDYTGCRIKKKSEVDKTPATGDTKNTVYPSVVFQLPATVPPSSDFFVDNEWVLTDIFKKMVEDDIVSVVNSGIEQILSQNPEAKDRVNVYLKGLRIDTSCSTLPNGVPKQSPGADKYSKGITFVQLSSERNNAAKEYIINRLKGLNVGIDDKSIITQNANGKNTGELLGTSGPRWNSKLKNSEKNKLRPQYEQYKYAKIGLDLQFNDTKPVPKTETGTTTPDKVVTNVDYDVIMTKRKGFTMKIPKVSFMLGHNPGFKGVRSLDCEFFNNQRSDKGQWWKDKNLFYQ
jgi:hypothetical protein